MNCKFIVLNSNYTFNEEFRKNFQIWNLCSERFTCVNFQLFYFIPFLLAWNFSANFTRSYIYIYIYISFSLVYRARPGLFLFRITRCKSRVKRAAFHFRRSNSNLERRARFSSKFSPLTSRYIEHRSCNTADVSPLVSWHGECVERVR